MSGIEYALTPAQSRLLDKVRDKGEVRCNGRREKTVKALEARGLVRFRLEVAPDCKRGTALFWVVTPAPSKPIRALLAKVKP